MYSMLLSKTVLSYEKQLKELLRKDPRNFPKIKSLLKEAVTLCQSENNTLRYLRFWLYLATLTYQPLDVIRHLLDKNIGTSHSLLYQDMAYYYTAENRKDMAENILRQGISLNARPLEQLQQSIKDLNNGVIGSAPPSIKDPLPTTQIQEAELPLLMVGLGFEGILGVFDAMELFVRQMARVSLFEEFEHYCISSDEMRAELSIFQAEDAARQNSTTRPLSSSLDPDNITEQDCESFLQHIQARDEVKSGTENQDEILNLRQGKIRYLLYHPSALKMVEQQQQQFVNNLATIITFPLEHDYKQLLVEPYLPLDSTYDLIQPGNLGSLVDLKSNMNMSLTLGQDTLCIQEILGEGQYGMVYLARWNSEMVAIKIHNIPDRWDHYMHQLIYQQCPDADRFFIRSYALYLDQQASYMIMEYASQGTLLDCLNTFREHDRVAVPEPLVQLLVLRLLQAIIMLHKSHITHNDLKLDNLLMCYTIVDTAKIQHKHQPQPPAQPPPLLYLTDDAHMDQVSIKVADFGLAVNLKLVTPPSAVSPVMMKGYQSSDKMAQMPAITFGLPWPPYHLDYWGIASCAHMLLFSTPMTLAIPKKLKRYWNESLWRRLFDVLLVHPPLTLDDGINVLHSLVTDLTLSLRNNTVRNDAIYHLHYYDRHYKTAHLSPPCTPTVSSIPISK